MALLYAVRRKAIYKEEILKRRQEKKWLALARRKKYNSEERNINQNNESGQR